MAKPKAQGYYKLVKFSSRNFKRSLLNILIEGEFQIFILKLFHFITVAEKKEICEQNV